MSYLRWAVLALAAYSMVAPLVGYATTGDPKMPPYVVALMTNGMLLLATVAVVAYGDYHPTAYLTHPKAPYVYLAGAFLAVGILAYYRALSLGPVSVVVPVFGLFLVVSSVVSVLFLNESLTARKAAGIGCAVVAVYLVSVE